MTDDTPGYVHAREPVASSAPPRPAVMAAPGGVRFRHPGVIVSVVATVIAVALVARTGERGRHNAYVADSVRITPIEGVVGIDGDPGVIAITSLVRLDPTAPITLLDARPYRMTPGTKLVAVRVSFHGRGLTRSGHQAFPGYPLGDCSSRLAGGFGASYPVEGIRLARQDPAQIIYYVQSHDPGIEIVTGYRIRYRTDRGVVRTVTGDLGRTEVELVPGIDDCIRETSGWTLPAPGWPS